MEYCKMQPKIFDQNDLYNQKQALLESYVALEVAIMNLKLTHEQSQNRGIHFMDPTEIALISQMIADLRSNILANSPIEDISLQASQIGIVIRQAAMRAPTARRQ